MEELGSGGGRTAPGSRPFRHGLGGAVLPLRSGAVRRVQTALLVPQFHIPQVAQAL